MKTSTASQKKKVLVLFAHPSIERSEANVELLAGSEQLPGVTIVELYREYCNLQIDIDREQQRLLDHDVVIFMFPMYWYSTPPLLKEWQDLVLEYGFAYGPGGNALHGKTFLCALTAGGPKSAYCEQGYNKCSLRELLRPLEQTADLCGMQVVAPFALFGSRTAVEENRLQCHVDEWLLLLEALRDDQLDIQQAKGLPMLNGQLSILIGAAA